MWVKTLNLRAIGRVHRGIRSRRRTAVALLLAPIAGFVSDKIGRTTHMILFALLLLVSIFPAFLMLTGQADAHHHPARRALARRTQVAVLRAAGRADVGAVSAGDTRDRARAQLQYRRHACSAAWGRPS